MGWAEQLLWPTEETTAFLPPLLYSQGFVKAHKNLQHYSILQAGQAVRIYIYIDLMRLVQIKLMRLTVCFWNL